MKRIDPLHVKRYNKTKVRHQRRDLDQRRQRATGTKSNEGQETLSAPKTRPSQKNVSSFTKAVREFGERRRNFETKAYSEATKKVNTLTKGRLTMQKPGLFMRGKVSNVASRGSPLTELNKARLDDNLLRIIRLANAGDNDEQAPSQGRLYDQAPRKANMGYRTSFAATQSSPISDPVNDNDNNSQYVDDPPTPRIQETSRNKRGKRMKAGDEKDFLSDLSLSDRFSPRHMSTERNPKPKVSVRNVASRKPSEAVKKNHLPAPKLRTNYVSPIDSDTESIYSSDSSAELMESFRCQATDVPEEGSYKHFANPTKSYLREFQAGDYWCKPKQSIMETAKAKLQKLFCKVERITLTDDGNSPTVEGKYASPKNCLANLKDANKLHVNKLSDKNRPPVIQQHITAPAALVCVPSAQTEPSMTRGHQANVVVRNSKFVEKQAPAAFQRNSNVQYDTSGNYVRGGYFEQRATSCNHQSDMNAVYQKQYELERNGHVAVSQSRSNIQLASYQTNIEPLSPTVDDSGTFAFSPYVPPDPIIMDPIRFLEATLGNAQHREDRRDGNYCERENRWDGCYEEEDRRDGNYVREERRDGNYVREERMDLREACSYSSENNMDNMAYDSDSPEILYERSPGWNKFPQQCDQSRVRQETSWNSRQDWRMLPRAYNNGSVDKTFRQQRLSERSVVQEPVRKKYYLADRCSYAAAQDDCRPPQQRHSSDRRSSDDLGRDSRLRSETNQRRRDSGFWDEDDKDIIIIRKPVIESPVCKFYPRSMF